LWFGFDVGWGGTFFFSNACWSNMLECHLWRAFRSMIIVQPLVRPKPPIGGWCVSWPNSWNAFFFPIQIPRIQEINKVKICLLCTIF
jgi:hypothetical protein